MSTVPLYPPKFREVDANGSPLANGKLYTYAAGTSTPLPTYTTRAGDVLNPNPVILDANGRADIWVPPDTLYKLVLTDADDAVQWTEDNVPSPGSDPSSSSSSADADTLEPGGRLTFATAAPIPSVNVSGAGTVYYTPYRHNQVPIWDGARWGLHTFAELSQAAGDATKSPAAVAPSSVYDCFIWNDAGTLRLSRGQAWASSTSRGTGAGTTELVLIGTRYVNKWPISNGPLGGGGLYVGTVCSNVSSLFDDSLTVRHVWNAYNRVPRAMRVTDAATSWNYKSTTFRQANANGANQLDFVVGLLEEPVSAEVVVKVTISNPPTGTDTANVGIGFGNTTPFGYRESVTPPAPGGYAALRAKYFGLAFGRTVLLWLESGGNDSTSLITWSSGGGVSAEMTGLLWA